MVSLRDAGVLGSVGGVCIDRDSYRVKYIFTNENTTVYAPEKIYAHKDILTVLDPNGEPAERAAGMLALTIGTAIYGVRRAYT